MRGKLFVPFFLMGWFGAHGDLFVELTLRNSPPDASRWFSAVSTALFCGLLGMLLSQKRARPWESRAVLFVPLLGALNASVIALFWARNAVAVLLAAVPGACYAFLYLPAVWFIGAAEFHTHAPEVGSFIDRLEQRASWRATAVVLVIWALINSAIGNATLLATHPAIATALAALVAAVLLARDTGVFAPLSNAKKSGSLVAHDGPALGKTLVVGIGDAVSVAKKLSGSPYREDHNFALVVRGDLELGLRLAARAVAFDALIFVAALAATGWLLFR